MLIVRTFDTFPTSKTRWVVVVECRMTHIHAARTTVKRIRTFRNRKRTGDKLLLGGYWQQPAGAWRHTSNVFAGAAAARRRRRRRRRFTRFAHFDAVARARHVRRTRARARSLDE